jgi:hypothetical protein
MRALAKALVAEAWEGADGQPADLVIAVDDVELHNFGREELICQHFRAAIEDEVQRREFGLETEERLRARLRERCSFHLLCPMVEAYFFGDRPALVRAGCGLRVAPQLSNTDLEDFECCDANWLPRCVEIDGQMAAPPNPTPWWREQRHAKHYLEHLVEQNGGLYDEFVGGNVAFAKLAWPRVAAGGRSIALIRVMFEDLALFFGSNNPLGDQTPSPLTYPARTVDRTTLMLRNL